MYKLMPSKMTVPKNMPGKRATYLFIVCCLLILSQGCVYFNTFYNGRKAFNEAESARKASLSRGRQVIQSNRYQIAVDKSLKVIENHPNSGYYDDALFILGVSYYYLKQYGNSERRLRELMANYPDSKYFDDATLYLAKTKLLQEDESDAKNFENNFYFLFSRVDRSYRKRPPEINICRWQSDMHKLSRFNGFGLRKLSKNDRKIVVFEISFLYN